MPIAAILAALDGAIPMVASLVALAQQAHDAATNPTDRAALAQRIAALAASNDQSHKDIQEG